MTDHSMTTSFEHLEASSQKQLQRYLTQFHEAVEKSGGLGDALSPEFWLQFQKVWAGSNYVAEQMARTPESMLARLGEGPLTSPCTLEDYRRRLQLRLENVSDIKPMSETLRRFRHEEMVRIIWRDLADLAPVLEITGELSALAEACVDESLKLLYQWEVARFGRPIGSESGLPQQLVVLGMGKLGAFELNLSSDIDLIFCFAESGETDGRRSRSNQEFFTRLSQYLIQVLDERTAYGFVFRVDMRLRPYGQSGSLALNFNAMQLYYEEQGRDWERYAMIKARVIAGDQETGAQLMASLNPFIYRRYVDFGAFAALREMKGMITREVQRRKAETDIKIGSGGIREIEFIVQSFQLIRGGKDTQLQDQRLWKVLSVLEDEGYLPSQVVNELREAYLFLRRCEHRIQALDDRQTQVLPVDSADQLRLALSMAYKNWEELERALAGHRQKVSHHFAQVVRSEEDDQEQSSLPLADLFPLWLDELGAEEAQTVLVSHGFSQEESPDVLEQLRILRESRGVSLLQVLSRERLDRFIPLLLHESGQAQHGSEVLKRLLPVLSAILRRSAYIALLVENPQALARLVELVAASPWIASSLEKQPLWLDELIDSRTLFRLPSTQALRDELRQMMLRIPEDDLEQQMECLRHFQKANVFRVAASEVLGHLPLMEISDYLTWIAEVVLQEALKMSWQQMVEKYGYPSSQHGDSEQPQFIIAAYGKMGGLELGYGSDLDLVFLYDAPASGQTNGSHQVENPVFYTRLCQRLIHIMTATTYSGTLYEIDQRLRPSGASGLMVSSMEAFASYQSGRAWTWEHQALVRARVVAGSEDVATRFLAIRQQILVAPREQNTLLEEVVLMRDKMKQHQSKVKPGFFHLKHGDGGIVDIEFMVQYEVLRWAAEHPQLLDFTDNVRILETLSKLGLMSATETEILRDAYLEYRSATHRCALQNQNPEVDADSFAVQQAAVTQVWQKHMQHA
ncbi:MAG: bifunctional [glutamate--ammonia ligase]-adenylyl-L-tyrosine phosphorylase/[glutamate--ammonia-ligase] adenylyltransferase [Pseudomonadales bacterium]|nr:bifunctional [glutamate--ammonia ligase]-adenylyl-L-tyrosine phosphorylase/[glutamate--ammonia-ligase] adenylyltransferase [Pseudomonadales bacterium]